MLPISQIGTRLRAVRHKGYVRAFSGVAPYYVVNEFPKCGGTWLSQMLSAAMELPFRRNQPVRIEPSITHGHFLHPAGLRNVIVLWRDPRDMLVSFYFHCFFIKQHGNGLMVDLMRARAPFDDFDDVRANMPTFIELIEKQPLTPRFTWPQFVETWARREEIQQVKYEDLRREPVPELRRIVAGLTGQELPAHFAQAAVAANTFEKAKANAEAEKAAAGEDGVAFVREGSVGGWRRHFSAEAKAALDCYGYSEGIRLLGYPSE